MAEAGQRESADAGEATDGDVSTDEEASEFASVSGPSVDVAAGESGAAAGRAPPLRVSSVVTSVCGGASCRSTKPIATPAAMIPSRIAYLDSRGIVEESRNRDGQGKVDGSLFGRPCDKPSPVTVDRRTYRM